VHVLPEALTVILETSAGYYTNSSVVFYDHIATVYAVIPFPAPSRKIFPKHDWFCASLPFIHYRLRQNATLECQALTQRFLYDEDHQVIAHGDV
jgi:hypothetical protein